MPTLPFNDLCEGGDDYIFQKTRNLVATENDLLAVGACAANATLTSTASSPRQASLHRKALPQPFHHHTDNGQFLP